MDITLPAQRTATYQNSFFPQTIKDWNSIDIAIRQTVSLESFKETQKLANPQKPNPLFHHNSSKPAINQTRIRLGLSGLSSQRNDYNHIPDPKFPSCNAKVENPTHFFLTCPTYTGPCHNLMLETCEILSKYNIQINFNHRLFR